jgi:uncharacterized iron-regulated protein
MITAAAFFLAVATTAADHPYTLPIGRPGSATVRPGQLLDMRTLREVSPEEIAIAADGHRFVYLGEQHDNLAHHQMQAKIIEALSLRRPVAVGLEMFTRPAQLNLHAWTLGWQTEEQFIEASDWKNQWGFDFALYRPIFEVIRTRRLPMVALNVPRDWVRQVGREGLDALTPEQRSELPAMIDLSNRNHRRVFESLMGGHPMTGNRAENIYAAQVLWDEGMADTALKYLAGRPAATRLAFVVVAGNGHVMYGQGINWRVKQRTGEPGITVVMIDSAEPVGVARGIAEFVYCAPSAK